MKKILYVEDDAINALIVRKLLQKDFQITVATDSQTCFDNLDKATFDIILMDINLGEKNDGVQTMQKVKLHPNAKHTKVLAVTAFSLPEDKKKYIESGFDGYVMKPIDEKELVDSIQKALD
jgi:two-component system, cell cycle response regulator DivK